MGSESGNQVDGGVCPAPVAGWRQAFADGRSEAQAAMASGRPAWRWLLLTVHCSPLLLAVASVGLGGLGFLLSVQHWGHPFARNLNAAASWARSAAELSHDLGLFLARHKIGPPLFHQDPLELILFLAVWVSGFAGLAYASVAASLISGLTGRRRWPGPLALRDVVLWDAGRLYGLWNHLAGAADSVRRKTVTGSQLLLVRAGVNSSIDMVKMIVVGWVLTAADYGLQGLTMVMITLLDSFTGMGIDIIIQRDGDDYPERLPTYWTIQFCRGFILFLVAWFAAPILAGAYAEQLARTEYSPRFFIWFTRVVALSFLFKGMAGYGRELRQRTMDFRPVILADITVGVSTLTLSLVVLFLTRNVWGLAAFVILDAVAAFVVSYVLAPWRPSFAWNPVAARSVAAFASSIVTITVLNGLAGRCDHALVAKLAGMAALGYYGRAYALANIPSQNFTNIIAPVMLPALRSVSHDRQRFRRAFLKCLAAYAVGAVAVAVAFAVVARPLVLYVLGQSGKWEPVLPPLYVLLLFGVAKAIGSVTPAALFVLNRPWTVTLCTGVWCAGVCGGCYPMIRAFGVMGAAWTVVLSSLASASLAVYLVLRAVRLDGAGPRDPR